MDGPPASEPAQVATSSRTPPFVDFSQTQVVANSRFVRMETLAYTDRHGRAKKWDRFVRTTRRAEQAIDAVCILATLRRGGQGEAKRRRLQQEAPGGGGSEADEEELMLVKQFRPALNGHTLELPAGLIDEGESPAEAALRELKEESGYVGTLVSVSKTGFPLSPGLTNENVAMVVVDVDLDAAENQTPRLRDGEACIPVRVKKGQLLNELQRLQDEATSANQELHVFFGLYNLALGMELGAGRL